MPRGDRTGPDGLGPMTGRGMGYCAGFNAPGYAYGGRRFFGAGFGRGRGFRNRYWLTGLPFWARYGYAEYPDVPPVNAVDEKAVLANERQMLEQQLKHINERLNNLEKADNKGE